MHTSGHGITVGCRHPAAPARHPTPPVSWSRGLSGRPNHAMARPCLAPSAHGHFRARSVASPRRVCAEELDFSFARPLLDPFPTRATHPPASRRCSSPDTHCTLLTLDRAAIAAQLMCRRIWATGEASART